MILSTHALVGATIGKNVENIWLIILFSIVGHFLLDTLRHGEYLNRKSNFKDTTWKVALDIFIGWSIIAFFLFYQKWPSDVLFRVAIGTFSSMFPDLLTLLYFKFTFRFLKPVYDFHTWIHRYGQNAPERKWTRRNAANDIIISLIACIILFI